MAKFEKISKYADTDIALPTRATKYSAGYDLAAAEDIVVPPIEFFTTKVRDKFFQDKPNADYYGFLKPLTLDAIAGMTKELKSKITLVPTGIKCKLDDNQYLAIVPRSSLPLKHYLMVANSVGR